MKAVNDNNNKDTWISELVKRKLSLINIWR